jgi:hypothetical protein
MLSPATNAATRSDPQHNGPFAHAAVSVIDAYSFQVLILRVYHRDRSGKIVQPRCGFFFGSSCCHNCYKKNYALFVRNEDVFLTSDIKRDWSVAVGGREFDLACETERED